MAYKILFSDYDYETVNIEVELIKRNFPDVEIIHAGCKTEEDVIKAARDVDAIINQYAPVSRKVIDTLGKCKVIARYGVGYNTIDVEAAKERGIKVCNVTDYCLDEVSDHAMSLLLGLARNIAMFDKQIKNKVWDFKKATPIFRLRNRVLGLFSLGNIAQKVAKKAQAFGIKVIAYDPYISKDIAVELEVELVEMDELLRTSDFVSIHTPLMEATYHMIGKEEFRLMKKDAFIINTSRGPIIDEEALIEALQTKEIAGAGLDVLEVEPIDQANPLLEMDQVILSPHAAWYSVESEEELKRKTAQNVVDVLLGKELKYVVHA